MHLLLLILQWQLAQAPAPPPTAQTEPETVKRPAESQSRFRLATVPGRRSLRSPVSGTDGTALARSRPGLLARNPVTATVGAYAFIPALATLLGMQMWEWGDTTHFKAGSDGWMERRQTHGGADKTGHMWSFYFGARLFTLYFDEVFPEDPRKAAYFGVGLSYLGSIAVEIGDGFASAYGFSYTDLAFNTAGVLLALAQELWPAVDDLLDLSTFVNYSPGFLSPKNPNKLDFATDYSGQVTTLHLRLGGLGLARNNPLRYLRLDVGYFARCYEVNDGCSKEALGTRDFETRNLYFGVSFDLARMIRDHGDADSWWQGFGTATRFYNVQGFVPVGFNLDLNHGNRVNFGQNTDSQLR